MCKPLNRIVIALSIGLFCGAPLYADTGPITGLPGDITLDGDVNVMDVQKGINQVLGTESVTGEADLDANSLVDVLDVQNLINSALGTGGLFQKVIGVVDPDLLPQDAAVEIHALSDNGLTLSSPVDGEDGHFILSLRVATGWSLSIVDVDNDRVLGAILFRIEEAVAGSLPLPMLSIGEVLDLGFITPGETIATDLRDLMASIAQELDDSDGNGDDIPDFLAPLFEALMAESILDQVFDIWPGLSLNTEELVQSVMECAYGGGAMEAALEPSLTDADQNDIPDFMDGLVICIALTMTECLDSSGVPDFWLVDENGDGIADFMESSLDDIAEVIDLFLQESFADRPDLIDENGNAVPDYIEGELLLPALNMFTAHDADQDGMADWMADDDEDGVPNFIDPDAHVAGDADGDGIADENDWDADNDGRPNYADEQPLSGA